MTNLHSVRRAQAGDHAAYTALVSAYRQMVYGICYRMTGNTDDADDLAHETFVEGFLKIGTLRDPALFGAWLRTLALNLCRMWLRGRTGETVELTEEIPAERSEEPEAWSGRVSHGLLHLSAPLRVTLVLHYLEGLSYDEVAKFLRVPVGTVMSRLHRGRAALKQVVEEMAEEEIPMLPDEDFTREVDAEIAVLMRIFREEPSAAERLSVLLAHAPERLARLVAETDDADTHAHLGRLLRRLGRPGIEIVVSTALTDEPCMRQRAMHVLRDFLARLRQSEPGVTQGESGQWSEVYLLLDAVIRSTAPAARKAELLIELLEIDSAFAIIKAVLLCYPDAALPALLARFWQASELPGYAVNGPVLKTLASMGTRFVAALLAPLSSGETARQIVALNGLEAFARSLTAGLRHGDAIPVRYQGAFGPIPPEQVDATVVEDTVQRVAALLADPRGEIRSRAVRVLGLLKCAAYREALETAVENGDAETRTAALRALAEIGMPESIPVYCSAACHGSERTGRVAAIEALGRSGAVTAVPLLRRLLADPDAKVRQVAATALGDIGGEEAREALHAAKSSGDSALVRTAAKALHTSPHFQQRRKPNETLQQLRHEVRERLVGSDTEPDLIISVHAAISELPAIRAYDERELTRYIARVCHDYSTTRRLLIMEKLMRRAAGIYDLTDLGQAVWRVEQFIKAHYLK